MAQFKAGDIIRCIVRDAPFEVGRLASVVDGGDIVRPVSIAAGGGRVGFIWGNRWALVAPASPETILLDAIKARAIAIAEYTDPAPAFGTELSVLQGLLGKVGLVIHLETTRTATIVPVASF